MESRTVILVPVNKLKQAPYNPKDRTKPEALKKLATSIDQIGLQYPLLITGQFQVVDGHRRLAVLKSKGVKKIPCLVSTGLQDKVYADVNATGIKMGGHDALGVWLANPMAVSPALATRFTKAESIVGMSMLKKLYKRGLSLRVYNLAVTVAIRCDVYSPARVCRILNWLMKFEAVGKVKRALDSGESAQLILRAIDEMKPIKFRLAV